MNVLSHRENNALANILERLAELERQVRQIPSRPAQLAPKALNIDVVQPAHGFTVGKAVIIVTGGTWALFTNYTATSYHPTRPLWGIISAVTGPDSFRLTIAGEGLTQSTNLIPGRWYGFSNGDPVLIQGGYPPFEGVGAAVAVMAMSPTSVIVANDGRFQGLQSQDGVYAVVSHPSIGVGHYVVYSGVPGGGGSPLALADEANPWKWTNVGIALFEVGVAGSWLVLVAGTHTWSSIDTGDTRPGWMTGSPFNIGQRIYLSDTNPGEWATTEPAFKVYAGISSASYTPASPPNPSETTFSAVAVGQGVPYPIPASGGGTGTDISTINEHAIIYTNTYGTPSARRMAGLLSLTPDYAVVAQKNGEVPVHLSLDLAANGTFRVELGQLYGTICGKMISGDAPVEGSLLLYDGVEWTPYGPLLENLGELLSHDGTELVRVDASTAKSVLGVAGGAAAVPAPIVGTDNNVLLCRSGALAFAKVRAADMESQQTTGKWILGTNAGGTPTWLTNEDARDNFDLQNVKCFRGALQGDTVIYGENDPFGSGIGTRLLIHGSATEPTVADGRVIAQREGLCSHWYYGNAVILSVPSDMLFRNPVAFENHVRVSDARSIAFQYGYSGGTDDTFIEKDKIYTNKIYAAQMYPGNGYTGTVAVRNSAGTGITYLEYTNGILTGVS